jgi:hypothetical protein
LGVLEKIVLSAALSGAALMDFLVFLPLEPAQARLLRVNDRLTR